MPELPEVETVCRTMQLALPGKTIMNIETSNKRLREPIDHQRLLSIVKEKFVNVTRRAKYILIRLDSGVVLLIHLGMSGNLLLRKPGLKHDHIVFHLNNGQPLVFNDPRRFGMLIVIEKDKENLCTYLSHLGVEPLTAKFNRQYLLRACQGKTRPIKNIIMDSSIVVGIGNIYANEALFRANINPYTPAQDIVLAKLIELTKAIKSVLRKAVSKGGTTINDYLGSGTGGRFQQKLAVYGRDGKSCNNCTQNIQKDMLAGRSTFYCPTCQK